MFCVRIVELGFVSGERDLRRYNVWEFGRIRVWSKDFSEEEVGFD